jgi:hypothetical protein
LQNSLVGEGVGEPNYGEWIESLALCILCAMNWVMTKIRQQLIANNSQNTVRSSFCGFFDTYSQSITCEVPTRYRADTGKDSVKSTKKFLIFDNRSG